MISWICERRRNLITRLLFFGLLRDFQCPWISTLSGKEENPIVEGRWTKTRSVYSQRCIFSSSGEFRDGTDVAPRITSGTHVHKLSVHILFSDQDRCVYASNYELP